MKFPAPLPRAFWLVMAFALLTGIVLAVALWFLREEAVRASQERTESLSQVIAEQTARTFQAIDTRLQLVAMQLEAMRAAGQLDEATARSFLRSQLPDLPFLRAIRVLDAEGRVVLDSDEGNIGVSLADREYFQAYRRNPATGFLVGPLVRSRSTGAWLMSASRPLRGADGKLLGVIASAVEPPYFERLWRGIDLGQDGAIVLYQRSGQLMLRSPGDDSLMGRDNSQIPLFTQYLAQSPQGFFVGTSPIDGVRRMVSYRTLPTYSQLVVAVGSSVDEMLEPWQRFAMLAAAVWGAAVLIAAGLTLQLHRKVASQQESERRFRQLAQAVPQIVFITDTRGAVRFVNQRWSEVTGWPVQDALGAGWREVMHPDDRDATVASLAKMLATGEELELEFRLRHRDGSYRWQLLRAVPFHEDGQDWWYGTATDIDEMKQAQARLHEQAELLKMAGRLARMGGWTVQLDDERLHWSEEAAAILDMPADAEPTLQEVVAMLSPRSLAETLHALQDCIDHGKPFDVEVELVTPTGRAVWVRSIGQPVFDAAGKVVGMQGAQQDITQRVRMLGEIRDLNVLLEERIAQRTSELIRQEALFRTLAEQAPLPIWTVDPRGQATFFSRAWYALTGGAPPKWQGYEWVDLVHPDDVEAMRANWLASARAGTLYAGVRRIRAQDGTYHTTSYRAVPVRSDAGEILFWVGVDSDVTELVANQAALRLANEQLESFAYSVSHDLQSPLQRIQSFAKLLQGELAGAPAEKARHFLARIRSNADAMAQLIEGLLALAQVSEVDMILSTVSLSELATGVLQRLQADHPQRRVEWTVQPGLAVTGDVRLMRSVMENLVGNAWKFTAGKPVARIEVGGCPERGEYFVRDNGAGFDMAYADRLFGTFQRLHDAADFPGTGIGLATVARAITRQHGRIWAQSAPGEGATFWFSLPPA